MAGTRWVLRATVAVVLVAGSTACSSTPVASPTGASAPTASAPTATPVPTTPEPTVAPSSPPVATTAPTAPTEPSHSAKPVPSIDQATLDAMLTSSITLLNLADDDLAVVVLYHETKGDTPFPLGDYRLAFSDQQTYDVPAGLYDLEFRQPADGTTGESCTIELGATDAYTFAAVDGAVAIARAGEPPTQARELFVATSSLCIE